MKTIKATNLFLLMLGILLALIFVAFIVFKIISFAQEKQHEEDIATLLAVTE